jgi:chromosome segregation ATPase
VTGLLESIRNLVSTREERVSEDDVVEFYRREKQAELENAREKADRFSDETSKILRQLEDHLEELRGYRDEKGIQAVEDVAENFHNSRKNMIQELEVPADIREHEEELSRFVEEFNDVSQKEGQVLKHIEKGGGGLPDANQDLVDHHRDLQEFLETGYSPVRDLQQIREKQQEISEKRERLEQVERELEQPGTEELESKVQEKKEELEELENSQDWREKQEKEQRIEELREEKKQMVSDLSRQVSRIDRSLKKILYSIENGEVEFDADREKLEKLADQDFHRVSDPSEELEEALRIIEENDIVSETQRERFSGSVEKLSDLEKRKDEMSEKEDEINRLEQQLEDMEVQEEKRKLEREIESLEDDLEEKKQERNELEEERKKLETEIQSLRKGLEQKLESSLSFKVELEPEES